MALIYIVEDDKNIQELVAYALKSEGHEAFGIDDGKNLKNQLKNKIPDLILLDIMLPGDDGFSLLEKLKSKEKYSDIPIIMLTAKSEEYDKVKGLDLGADDYISKPFSVLELLSRVRAVLRRYEKTSKIKKKKIMEIEKLSINLDSRKVLIGNDEIDLTYKEYELLRYLFNNKNIVVTRNMIMNEVWGYDYEGESRTLDVHIRSLRQKLGDYGDFIQTVRNVGYKLEV